MRAVADEMKVIDLHVPKLTADWFSREEYEKFREDPQGKIIHIDAQSASTSKKRKFDVPISLRDFVMKDLDQKWRSWKYDFRTKFFTPYQKVQQHFACSDRRVVEDQWKKLVQIWSSKEFKFLKTGATLDRGDLFIRTGMKKAGGPVNDESAAMIDSLAGSRVRILNFSGEVVASGILMFDDNDNVVMGKKLGGEYYEVSILIAHDPTASLFIKDADRKNMNDDVGSHIIWFREYLKVMQKVSLSTYILYSTVKITTTRRHRWNSSFKVSISSFGQLLKKETSCDGEVPLRRSGRGGVGRLMAEQRRGVRSRCRAVVKALFRSVASWVLKVKSFSRLPFPPFSPSLLFFPLPSSPAMGRFPSGDLGVVVLAGSWRSSVVE
ncbi:hypothetical protein Taro_053117 [Colocasia esculenta]|uniref:Uncharacterized protein n=1 Tax=Colocasia esculenta TaxID=4460 RepID=A0A843XLM5_COLES|nr:hypothetical protein [Colocasia esculenta]